MVYCRYCGKPIEDDSHFCPFCGKEQELKRGSINYSKLWKRFAYFTKNKFNNIQKFCSKIRIPKTRVNSPSRSRLILWAKRFSIITLIPIAVYLIFMLSLWIYGLYITAKWQNDDNRREAIALKDISKADKIARDLFKEYASKSHLYDYDNSECGFDHINRGIEIIRKAAEGGNDEAQFTLGCIYNGARYDKEPIGWDDRTMMNTEINQIRGAYWYYQAALQGNHRGMCNLANAYRYGKGVEKDLFRATELMKTAAEKGNPVAQCNLGDMYRDGEIWIKIETDSIEGGETIIINSKPNIKKAKEWWTKALKNGHSQAKERLEKIYE